jgi:hypothetical protein
MALAYVSMALVGGFVATVVAARVGQGGFVLRSVTLYDIWLVVSGGLGGMGGLRLVRDRLGHPGLPGLWHSLIGAFYATFLAGLIGGSLALPLYGTMFGPFTLAVTLLGAPMLLVMWGVVFVIAHLQLREWQSERNSIFAPRRTAV